MKEAARFYAARDYNAAEAVSRTIIRHDPHHFDALHALGVLLLKQDRPEEAVTCLGRAGAEQPDHGLPRVNLSNALLAAKQSTGCGFLKAGESGCKPLWSRDFCWRTGFGVNPIAEWSEWPKVGFGNAIFS
jgi:Tetratricopeptide repeat